jgi:adenylate cyclase
MTSSSRPPGVLERAYRRLGPRYPGRAIAWVVQMAHVNVVLGIVGLALYVEMSPDEFIRIVIAGMALMAAYNVAYLRVARELLAPVRRWLDGTKDGAATIAAWQACATFPREMMRREWIGRLLGGLSYGGLLVWAGLTTWQLDLPPYTVAPLFAGIMAAFVTYVQLLRFFTLERVLRPILRDISEDDAIDEAVLYVDGLPLRTRLLVTLPAINVITGVVAVGITGYGTLELLDLGVSVGVSLFIAGSISLALTFLLSDSVTKPVESLHDATERIGRGEFDARVPVVSTDETAALAQSFNRMAAGLEQRERLREAFGTYVDPDLTERVLEEGTEVAGTEVEASLLFLDIRGFTSYAETANAQDVVARLNRLYGEVVPVVLEHGGQANKFIGDGLLAVFGAPDPLPDHADRAVAAALEIARVVDDCFGGDLSVGIGVNSGRVVAGTIGGGGRLDFTVIGDAVNTASRVESATRATGDDILITEATLRLLSSDPGSWEERPAMALKGKAEQVRLFGPRATAQATPAGQAAGRQRPA